MIQKTTLKACYSFLIMYLFVVNFGFGQSIFENPITGEDIDPEISNPYTNGQNVDPNITVSGILNLSPPFIDINPANDTDSFNFTAPSPLLGILSC